MANITFDLQWREAMMDLVDLMETENPEDPALAPKDLAEFSCIYVKYLQLFRNVEESYDQMVHPQKRNDIRKMLEAVLGRMLEIKHWMVKLSKGSDLIQLGDILVDLKLTPDVLEVPVPRFMLLDRRRELEDRNKFLSALIDKYSVVPYVENLSVSLPPLPLEEAIRVIQINERGRQGRERARIMKNIKEQQEAELRLQRMGGEGLSQEDAALRIQAAIRGFLARLHSKMIGNSELVFIGMKPPARSTVGDPMENEAEYNKAIVRIKKKVRDMEGQDMREVIQDKINAWFVEKRDVETGDYPDFPEPDEGGSKIILNPPPEEPPEESVDPRKKKDAASTAKKGAEKPGAKKPGAKDKKGAEEEKPPETMSRIFVQHIQNCLKDFVANWQDKDESDNFFQKHDPEMIKEAVRPVVFEEIRQDVDEEMKLLLINLKEMVAAERAKKGKKGKKPKKKAKKGAAKKGKKKKDPTSERSMESLYAELVSNGILMTVPKHTMDEYLGSFSYLGATLEKAAIVPEPSMSQVRAMVTEYCVLPLASLTVHSHVPHVKSVLLYGAPGTGKTLLASAVAHVTGSNLFNLSPRATDGKYTGKASALLIHMVFKVARAMAPSVIYINEAEKIFITDKKKIKEQGGQEPFNRIRKALVKETNTLTPGDRVLIIGNSAKPYLAAKATDSKNFMNFFTKHIYCPLPDYASYRLLWPGLVERAGGRLSYEFDLSTVAHISEGCTAGDIVKVCNALLTARRVSKIAERPLTESEVLGQLAKLTPVSKEDDTTMKEWTKKLPSHAWRYVVEEPPDAKKGKGKPGAKDAGKKPVKK
eukprot:jgi/Mesvir1/17996/Mv09337-RA.2